MNKNGKVDDRVITSIRRWGNSSGIRIPRAVLDKINAQENDEIEILVNEDTLVIKKTKRQHKNLKERLEAFYNKPIDKIGKIDNNEEELWGAPKGNEAW